MAIDLKSLSPKELKTLIAHAESQMHEAQAKHVQTVREKIDAILHSSGLTLADIYPTRSAGKGGAKGRRGAVAPKYRNPENASETWTGRGRQPLWIAAALKKRGVKLENLLISGVAQAPAKTAKKVARKATKKAVRKKSRR